MNVVDHLRGLNADDRLRAWHKLMRMDRETRMETFRRLRALDEYMEEHGCAPPDDVV